jgi:selenocysteine-specific elongation factor
MRPIVVGTAGHIDHGKTELVKALTGIDPDRLREEKERGITIDLGFAYLDYPDGARLAFVDVPGHERFIDNMLAGATGIDLVLLVVAADESVMPQTREHAEICRLLGVRSAVVALSKRDLVDEVGLELARMEARDLLRGCAFEAAEIVPVSARTGAGLDELRAALRRAAEATAPRGAGLPLRLPVDRVFSIRGFGTVVTGTAWGGRVALDQEVEILPSGLRARVRGLQVHHRPVAEAVAGQRTAVNLQGVSVEDLRRGVVLVEPETWTPATRMLARLEVDAALAVAGRARGLLLHHATSRTPVRWRWLGEPEKKERSLHGRVLLLARDALAAARGDRFVVRRLSPPATVGGGEILEAPARRGRDSLREHARALDGARAPRALLEDLRWPLSPWGAARTLWVAAGLDQPAFDAALVELERSGTVVRASGDVWIESERLRELEARALRRLEEFHAAEPLQAGMPVEELKRRLLEGAPRGAAEWLVLRLQSSGRVRSERDRLALRDHQVTLGDAEERVARSLEETFRASGLNPPEAAEAARACGAPPALADRLLHMLVRSGRLVRIKSGRLYHAQAMENLVETLRRYRAQSERIDVGRFKELTGTTRKNAIPLLEHLDASRITRRVGDERIIL